MTTVTTDPHAVKPFSPYSPRPDHEPPVGDLTRPEWGPWRYAPRTLTVECSGEGYDVDLERCTTSAEMLDWICQVASKVWATPEVVGGLVHALNDLLRPQATLCSCGAERGPLNVRHQLSTWPRRCADHHALLELERLAPGPISVEDLCDPLAALARAGGGSV